MIEDDELELLGSEWRAIEDEPPFDVSAALRRRGRQRTLFALELISCGLMLALALLFWFAGTGPVYRAAALLFVLAAVLSSVFAAKTRTRLSRWADWTPEGVLAFRLRECDAALLNAKAQIFSSAVLAAFAGFVWLAAELGWDTLPPRFHLLYAAIVAVTILAVGAWAVWRLRTKRAERTRLRRLLRELRED